MSDGKMNRMYLYPGWKTEKLNDKKFETLKQLAPFWYYHQPKSWYYHQPHDQLFCFLVSEHDFSWILQKVRWILQKVRNIPAYSSDDQSMVDNRGKMCHPPSVYSDKRLVKIAFWLSSDYRCEASCKYVYCVKRSLNARVSHDVVATFDIPPIRNIFVWVMWVKKLKDKPGVYNMFKSALKKR